MNASGGNPQNVTENRARDSNASWSPDGTQILFTSLRHDGLEIYVMNRNGRGIARLTHNQASEEDASWFGSGFPVPEQRQLRTLWGTLKRKP